MKKTFFTLLVISMALTRHIYAQPIQVSLSITNQLTKKPVDAQLTSSGTLQKTGTGLYTLTLQQGEKLSVQASKDGYFDTELPLDYSQEKTGNVHEIKLIPAPPELIISIFDNDTKQQLKSTIDLFTMDESSIVFSDEVETSPYTIDLEYNEVHVLQVRRPGYFSFKDTIDYSNVFEGRKRTKVINLVPLKQGNKISLNNIHFKPNESELTDFAKLMLVELTHVLENNKNIVIEIGAHTDDVGATDYNQALSERRALSVKKHLLEKGAAEKQLLTKGYGETSPMVPNTSDENREQNRRVEFRIISVK